MGTWGFGIYANDTASDVRDLCQEVYPFMSVEAGNKIVFTEYKHIMEQEFIDYDYVSFWYALAAWQWKHGILNSYIKDKTLELLSTDIKESYYKNELSAKDLRTRTKVLKKLEDQLNSDMSQNKLPKVKLEKPKHKVGDIIIMKTCDQEQDFENYIWNCDRLGSPLFYKNLHIKNNASNQLSKIKDFHSTYIAILCVGVKKILHSKYAPDLYDEESVYAFYDCFETVCPTLEFLKKKGFIPIAMCSSGKNELICENFRWVYMFRTSDSFRIHNSHINEIHKINCAEEAERFKELFNCKNYSQDSSWHHAMYDVFGKYINEKERLKALGIEIDTLLDKNYTNPELEEKIDFSS